MQIDLGEIQCCIVFGAHLLINYLLIAGIKFHFLHILNIPRHVVYHMTGNEEQNHMQYVNQVTDLIRGIKLHSCWQMSIPRHVTYQMVAYEEQKFLKHVKQVTDLIRGIKLHFFVKMKIPRHVVYQMEANEDQNYLSILIRSLTSFWVSNYIFLEKI